MYHKWEGRQPATAVNEQFLHIKQLFVAQIEPSPIPCLESLGRALEQVTFELSSIHGICVRAHEARQTILGKLTDARVTILHGLFQLT